MKLRVWRGYKRPLDYWMDWLPRPWLGPGAGRFKDKEQRVRLIIPLAVLMLGACDVENDPANEKVTVTYDRERIKQSAADAKRTAGDVARGVANVTEKTGRAIKEEVGDVDVDVRITRERARQPTEG